MEQYVKDMIIHCPTQETAAFLLRRMSKQGIKWSGGEPMLHTHWEVYRSQTCYRVRSDQKLNYANTSFYLSENYHVTEFSDLFPGYYEDGFRSEDIVSSLSNISPIFIRKYYKEPVDIETLWEAIEWKEIVKLYEFWKKYTETALTREEEERYWEQFCLAC